MIHKRKNTIFILILCLLPLLCINSCTDSTPEIARVYYSILYDFVDESLPPQVKLSVFIEPLSDARRVKEFTLYHKETDYTWTVELPLVITEEDKTYFGHQALVYPPNVEIREGRYEVRFYDLAMRDSSSFFMLENISSLKDVKVSSLSASAFRDKRFATECSIAQIVVYDILENVLYSGPKTTDFITDDAIRSLFPAAVSYRLFYKNQDNTTIIILPGVQLYEKVQNEQNEENNE